MDQDPAFRLKTILAFAAIYVVWGSTYIAIKYAVETIPPLLTMGTRSLVAGGILYLWGRARGGAQVRREHWPAILIIGASFFLVGHGLLGWAQQNVPSGLAALLIASEPLWILGIESIVLKDARVGAIGKAGLVVGLGGMALLILSSTELGFSQAEWIGVAAILIATASWSGGAVYSRVATLPRAPAVTAGLELATGGVLLLIASALFGEPQNLDPGSISSRSVYGLLYLIVFGSVITFSAYIWLLSFTSATRVSTHTYVNPVIAVLIGWALADEVLTFSMVVATILIVTSVYLVLKDHRVSSNL